jgi:hypothetical protein
MMTRWTTTVKLRMRGWVGGGRFHQDGYDHLHVPHYLLLGVRRITVMVMMVRVSHWCVVVFTVVGEMQ